MGAIGVTPQAETKTTKTGAELLEIIEANYDVSTFGYNEMGDTHEPVEVTAEEKAEGDRLQAEKSAYHERVKGNFDNLPYSERQKHPDFIQWQAMTSRWEHERNVITTKLGLGPVQEIEQHGGEDQGSTWYSIKYFPDHDVYIRTDGYYQSYSGTDFHEGYGKVVTPQQKTITVFE